MLARLLPPVLAALLVTACPALAATAQVTVVDRSGRGLSDAVAELFAAVPDSAPRANPLATEATIDQRHETFLPLVTLVRKGGRVTFTNNDTTMHQVYSFSAIKQFAFEIDEGQRSPPVTFEKPGIAAIGCNIHDRMITYVYVADSAFATKTDRAGIAILTDMPPGSYRGTIWHPRLALGTPPQAFAFVIAAGGRKAIVALPVSGIAADAKKTMHMQMY